MISLTYWTTGRYGKRRPLKRAEASFYEYPTWMFCLLDSYAHIMRERKGMIFRLLACVGTFGWECVLNTRMSSILTSNSTLSASRWSTDGSAMPLCHW